jgi:D-alanine-D-alanine ligase
MTKTVAVFFGGQSVEHDISIVTAIAAILKPLEITGEYTVVPVYIAKDGKWYSDDSLKDIKLYSSGYIEKYISKVSPLKVVIGDGLKLIKSGFLVSPIDVDIAFPAMHGAFGEDGSLMGLLRMAGIPFVGCDMEASVIAMDKVLAKQVVEANGISTPKALFLSRQEFLEEPKKLVARAKEQLKLPLFVKPAHLGSSIGITKVISFDDLENAIEVAVHYDDKALIEEGIQNLVEVTVPIMGNSDPQPALVEQPLLNDDEFFDFETKYIGEGKKKGGKKSGAQGYSNLPAKISKKLYDDAESVALEVYKVTGCQGIARIDLLIDSKAGKVYFNEINPLPGSLYAHNWKASGVSGVELVKKLIAYAEEAHSQRKQLETTFSTSFLKHTNI